MIAFNMQPLAVPELTGIGYYASNVARELLPMIGEYEIHAFDFRGRNNAVASLRAHLGDLVDGRGGAGAGARIDGADQTSAGAGAESAGAASSKIRLVKSMPLGAYIRLGSAGKLCSYEKLVGSSADLTVFFNYLTPGGLRGKSLITIYDMVCERFPETMDDRNRRLLQKHLRPSAERAGHIVTISEFSKREIVELLGVPEEKVSIAYCGVDTDYYSPFASSEEETAARSFVEERFGCSRYILYVGTLEPRKNIKTLVKAFDEIAGDHPDVSLILAGGLGWQPDVTLSAIDASPYKSRIIRPGYISNDEKRTLYRCASCFVFPSIYEGFGMPVTEAMACGTPCVISSSSSLPEAGGSCAMSVESSDVKGFAEAVDSLLCSRADSKFTDPSSLVTCASRFSWSKAAEVYKSAIDKVVGG